MNWAVSRRTRDNIGKLRCLSSMCVRGIIIKVRFHEMTKIDKINHRCIQIDRWVKETCRQRPMDIGAALADDKTFYFIFCRQEKWHFGQNVQYNVATN